MSHTCDGKLALAVPHDPPCPCRKRSEINLKSVEKLGRGGEAE